MVLLSIPSHWRKKVVSPLDLKSEPHAFHQRTMSDLSSTSAYANKKQLYLQAIRALQRYQSIHITDHIEVIMERLLECTKDNSFELTHTAEKALENLVVSQDSIRCLRCIIPYLGHIDQECESSKPPTIIWSSFRTLFKSDRDA